MRGDLADTSPLQVEIGRGSDDRSEVNVGVRLFWDLFVYYKTRIGVYVKSVANGRPFSSMVSDWLAAQPPANQNP